MQSKTGFERVWAGCDYLLLLTLILLLGIVWYSNSRDLAAMGKPGDARRWMSDGPFRRVPSAVRTVDGVRVSQGRTRVNSIARSMVDSGWDRSPSSPAMDIREQGETYEVFFSLPSGIAEDSVRVTAAGNVLTLTMKDDDTGKSYLQRIRIPCGAERPDKIYSVISNDVLRVRICPCGGCADEVSRENPDEEK